MAEAQRRAAARIHEMDRTLAPGSETALLGDALDSLRRDPSAANLAWWVGAYRMLEWAMWYPDAWARHMSGDVWDGPDEQILTSKEDWTGWTPPAPTPDELRAWREREGLTQTVAGRLAGATLSTWARWEAGTHPIPDTLRDVLLKRWGTAP